MTFLFSTFLMQAREVLDVPVKIDVQDGSTDGVTVSIIRNGVTSATVAGKRKMKLALEFNRNYTLVFKKENYISKSVEFDTHVSAARIQSGFEPYDIGVKLFSQSDKENIVVYNQAVAHISFDKTLDVFSYETDYSKSMLSQYDEEEDKDDALNEKELIKDPESFQKAPSDVRAVAKYSAAAAGLNSLTATASMSTSIPDETKKLNASTADFNAGSENPVDHNLFDQVTISTQEFKERTRIITLTTVTKGSVSTEYRKVVYQWGGVYFFKDNKSSISSEIYALRTTVKPVE